MAGRRDEAGFTLAEMLVAFAVLALVLVAVTTIQHRVLDSYVRGSNNAEVQQNVRVALERMAREIRESTVALTAAEDYTLSFTHPTDGAITYTVDQANTLLRNNDPVIGRVRNRVLNPQVRLFVYLDANDAPGASAANTRRVVITIQTGTEDVSAVAQGIAETKAELSTSVQLRNL